MREGVLQRANRALLNLTGATEAELIGPAGRFPVRGGGGDVPDPRARPHLQLQHAVHEVESSSPSRTGGEAVAVTVSTAGALPGRTNRARRGLHAATDITHRKFTERALVQARESRRRRGRGPRRSSTRRQ